MPFIIFGKFSPISSNIASHSILFLICCKLLLGLFSYALYFLMPCFIFHVSVLYLSNFLSSLVFPLILTYVFGCAGSQLQHAGPLLCPVGPFIAVRGLCSCGTRALELVDSVAVALGLVAPQHVGS